MTERLLYKPAEVGEAIGVSRARAYELIAQGSIPHIRVGSSIRVPVAALKEWVSRESQSVRAVIARHGVKKPGRPFVVAVQGAPLLAWSSSPGRPVLRTRR
jgi:excisionase family DNA binding protein